MNKVKMWFNRNPRFKNIYFYGGLIGVILLATGADPSTFTTWETVGNWLLATVSNPFMLFAVVGAVVGVVVNPTTKGLKDK